MSAATPVIASSIGGIPELVTDGVDGFLVAPGDVACLAGAMRRVMSDTALAARLGEAARRTVAQRFSRERHLEGLIASYRAAGAPA
jgi:glycosyltransferase involved in cell wall biosynthesis